MIQSLVSGLPAFALIALAIVMFGAILIGCALYIKGDVFAELSHGNTKLRIDARDKRPRGISTRNRRIRGASNLLGTAPNIPPSDELHKLSSGQIDNGPHCS